MTDIQLFRSLVSVENGEPVITSRTIAKAFGKQHKNILRSIESLECSDQFFDANFGFCSENSQSQNGKPLKFYKMTASGALAVIMGFTGKEAAEKKMALIEMISRRPVTHNILPNDDHEELARVYAIRCASTGLIKIGRTENMFRRTKQIQSMSAPIIDILAVSGLVQKSAETDIHKKFSKYRKHGEWFLLDEKAIKMLKLTIENL